VLQVRKMVTNLRAIQLFNEMFHEELEEIEMRKSILYRQEPNEEEIFLSEICTLFELK